MFEIITLIICTQRDNDSKDAKILKVCLNRTRGFVSLHANAMNGHADRSCDNQVMWVVVVTEARLTIIQEIGIRSLAYLGFDTDCRQQS
ncbi:hypothetical protein ALQ46_200064 [Pseudomonas savastanoi pv. phaseolicola]|nr:hypothetical protein ALQ46_200064 [Pseudomonas savastanoi pv. phaseolicola]